MTDSEEYDCPWCGPSIEKWAPFPGAGHYQFSNHDGRVRSVDRVIKGRHYAGQLLATRPSNKPDSAPPERRYRLVNIRMDTGMRKTVSVHSGVLLAHVDGGRPEGQEACHEGDRTGRNCLAWLRWDTPEANDRERYGEPAPPRPARPPCILCGGRVGAPNAKRCTECLTTIGVNAAAARHAGHTPEEISAMLDYPHVEGLMRLSVRYGGYTERRPGLLARLRGRFATKRDKSLTSHDSAV